MKQLIYLKLLAVCMPSIVQASEIIGTIRDNITNHHISFVNISIKDSYLGTVSDVDGKYRLKIPERYANATICFSCIGYESREISVSRLLKNGDIVLTPADVQLGEVTIMPDSTLRSFLRKAYEKIPQNYPSHPTQYEAFYREGIQNESKQYIRLVEAIVKANKSSYKNARAGTVQLIESRKYIDADSSKTFPISFYGGLHFIHGLDCVKERDAFLKLHKDYEYTYEGLTKYDNEPVHQIGFKARQGSNKSFEGTMYIHSKTLSYLRFDLRLNSKALEKRFDNPIKINYGLKSLSKTYVVNYKLSDSLCYLRSVYENEVIESRSGQMFYGPAEYVVTNTKASDVPVIPFSAQVPITYTPTVEATDYHQSDWKNYNTLANVSVVDTTFSKALLTNNKKQINRHDQLIKFISKLEFAFRVAYQPYQFSRGVRQVSIEGVSFENNLQDAGTTISLNSSIAYSLTPKLSVGYISEEGFSNKNLQKKQGPLISYKLPLKTMGNNLFLEPQLAYVWHKYGRSIGTQNFEKEFSFGGKNFKNSKIEALPGIKHHGLQVGSSLLYQLSPMFYLDVNASYYVPSKTEDVLFLKERSGFFLTRKTAHEPLDETEAVISIDGVPTQTSEISHDNWSVSIGLRLMF